ncbi:T9SS type A sorting domain-containing protein [Neolewinella antarctica]|uniref:Secretion system C-terminal sorting domain-containing protein n=1 Tax=Neolewinella antarctica TaxID=442734 RepID=A0ABX0X890_9BACT|nr:T9SS type A sorting domain-containing protein [Neolewinella antarctica]NJC25068.1 hypothetical protein [Neolewinella antarctica]
MHKLLLLLLCVCGGFAVQAQTVLEDFEGGTPDLVWEAVNGTYDGAVMNPNDTTANTSDWVGSYTKSGTNAFSLFRTVFDAPLDLSTDNLFSIQLNAGAATEMILKLQGGGRSAEKRINITTANVWRTYTFDLSALSDADSINTLILFFDPGVAESDSTYLFDNLTVSPAGPCAGTTEDVTIIDDFECQRNAAYRGGFENIEVIANPDPSGINQSTGVGQYTDGPGGFDALSINYDNGLDLSVNNYICIDVWAPVAGNLLVKLEGGASPVKEIPNQITTTMAWTQVCVDFSDQAAADHSQLVFFFNAGENGDGDVYYIDNITRTVAPVAEALEDFENGANLSWGPANNNSTVNGTYNGVVANPSTGGVNTSANVGSYTRAASNFSAISAELLEGLDLTTNPQLNLDVVAPAGATTVQLQLVSALEGVKTADATLTTPGTWETLNFNFENFEEITDFFQVNILFNPSTTGTGTYLFDNLGQGQSTIDACVDVENDPDVFDDFECQRNGEYTLGAEFLSVVNNPDVKPENNSLKVGQFIDQTGGFNALVIDRGEDNPFDFAQKNQIMAKIWSPVAGQILFKLEGGPNDVVEVFLDIPETMEWIDYSADFSAAAGQGHTRLALFFGAGENNTAPNTYFIDNIRVARAPFTMDCITTFEPGDLTLTDFNYFSNGSFEDEQFTIVDNPLVSDGNGSASVGSFIEANDGALFAGLASSPIAPIILGENKTITIKMLMPIAGTVVMKLERPVGGAPGSGDIAAEYTTPDVWQTLTFDFSNTQGGDPIPTGATYERLTLIPNRTEIPTENLTHYFDDIAVGGGLCGMTTGIFQPITIDELKVFPNPVADRLTIENANDATLFEVTNLLGQRQASLRINRGQDRVYLPVANLPTATYVLTARDETGVVVARTMFIKR